MTFLEMTLSGAVFILAIAAVRALTLRRLPKGAFVALWWAAALRLLIPVDLPSRLSVYTLIEALRPKQVPAAPITPVIPAVNDFPVYIVPSAPAAVPQPAPKPFPIWTALWLTGAAALALWALVRYVRWRRRFREALPADCPGVDTCLSCRRKVRLRVTDQISAPLTYGLFRPVVLLPGNLDLQDEEAITCVLAHELAHIRRLDGLFKFVLTAALCLHWFNPAAWLLYVLANRDMEFRCDEAAVLALGEDSRERYALALIRMAELRNERVPLCGFAHRSGMEERIKLIMSVKKKSMLACVMALALVLGITTAFATSAKPEEKPKTRDEVLPDDAVTVMALEDSVRYDSGNIYFTIPESEGRWSIFIQGRIVTEDGTGMSVHYLEEESEKADWVPRMTYSFETEDAAYDELTMDIRYGSAHECYPLTTILPEDLAPLETEPLPERKGGVPEDAGMVWPVDGDQITITNWFEERADPGGQSVTVHNGVDIGDLEQGAPIYAAAAGTVKEAGFNAADGYYVRLDHGNGLETFYAHCRSVEVKMGDTVTMGQTIAAVGSTGNSTGPHLHFEIWRDGTAQDPMDYYQTTTLRHEGNRDILALDDAPEAERYYEAGSLPLFQIAFSKLAEKEQLAWLEKLYANGDAAFFSAALNMLDGDSPLIASFAERAYGDNKIAFFSILADCMDETELGQWSDRALKDKKWNFQAMLFDKLGMDDEKDAMEKELEEKQLEEYRKAGVTKNGKNYYYQDKLVNIFLDARPDSSFYTLNMNPAGEVNVKIIRGADGQITGAASMTETEVKELLGGMDDSDEGSQEEPSWLREAKEQLVNGEYPRNSRGETYGLALAEEIVGYPPDLVGVVSTDGQEGWASYEVIHGRGEDVMTPEQLAAYKESQKIVGFHIFTYETPVYDDNGEQIGVFEKHIQLGNTFSAMQEAQEAVKNGWPNTEKQGGMEGWTPVYAAGKGTVKDAGYNDQDGHYVRLDHGGGQESFYAHCGSLLVQMGDEVAAGQTIGTVAAGQGESLQFEFLVDGVATDPLTFSRVNYSSRINMFSASQGNAEGKDYSGRPIIAIMDGTILNAGVRERGQVNRKGPYVEILYESGYSMKYTACQSVLVKTGDRVKAGDVIAYTGEGASASGPSAPEDRALQADWEERDRRSMEEEFVNGDYPRNSLGETYGRDYYEYLGYWPDLLAAYSDEDGVGYIARDEENYERSFSEEERAAFDNWCRENKVSGYTVPLYDSEHNQIGTFRGINDGMAPRSYRQVTLEEIKEARAQGFPNAKGSAADYRELPFETAEEAAEAVKNGWRWPEE